MRLLSPASALLVYTLSGSSALRLGERDDPKDASLKEDDRKEHEDDEDYYGHEDNYHTRKGRPVNEEEHMADGSHGYDFDSSLMESKKDEKHEKDASKYSSYDYDHEEETSGASSYDTKKGDGSHGYDFSSLLQEEEVKLRSGVGVKVVKKGEGKRYPRSGDQLTVHFTGSLAEGGKAFDSTRGGKPFTFTVGRKEKGKSVPGCVLPALLQMSEGQRSLIKVPSELAYGKQGEGGVIPPNADLVFDVELLKIK